MLDLDRKEGPVSSSETTESTCICAKRSTGTRQRGPLRCPGSLLRSRLVLWDLGLAGPESLATAGIVKSCLQSQKALMCWSILLYAVAFEQSLHAAGQSFDPRDCLGAIPVDQAFTPFQQRACAVPVSGDFGLRRESTLRLLPSLS
jgi:hypothetical protein